MSGTSTSVYFNNFRSSGEQNLYESLIIEAISIYGHDVYYIPRVLNNFDNLMNEDDQSSYSTPYFMCMYIKSVDGFTGDGNFMSKFGLEIRDQVIFSMAQKVFNQVVGINTGAIRPNEGDLIYFPLNQKCFQIKFVNKFEMFYQFGALQTWEVTCELFEYSNEIINTGITEIDTLQTKFSMDIFDWALLDESNKYLTDEFGNILVVDTYDFENINAAAQNDTIFNGTNNFSSGAKSILDFSESNPFAEGSNL
jgi:hypothetical protein